MKKLLVFLALCFLGLTLKGASLGGNVVIEGGGNFGVFVYIESENLYDITDEKGEFLIEGLDLNKEYKILFQKENYPEYKKIVKLDIEEKEIKVYIKQLGDSRPKYKVRGSVISSLNNQVFFNIPKLGYGIIVEPKRAFYFDMEEGKYQGVLIQDGSYEKKVKFKVEEREVNDIGNIKLKQKEKNNLRLLFRNINDPLYVYLYKGDEILKSKKITSEKPYLFWEGIKPGNYRIVGKGYGYKEIEEGIYIKGRVSRKINLEKLRRENNLYVNIYPEGLKTDIKLYLGETLIKEISNVRDFYIFENLDIKKDYRLEFEAEKYKMTERRNVKSGEKLEISLLRDIKGSIVSGNVFPFNSQAEVMVLEKGKVLGKTQIDSNGRFEIELDSIKSGKHMIRFYADGFKEERVIKTLNKGKYSGGLNVELESLVTSVFGKVMTGKFTPKDCLVIIDELNFWQFTNSKGEYYFNNIPDGRYTLIVKKLGFDEIKRTITVEKQKSKKINFNLEAKAKLIIKSNLKNYDLIINGEKEKVKNFVYEKKVGIGKIDLQAKRKGSLDIESQFYFSEPGQEKEIKLDFKSFQSHKMGLQNRIFEIEDDIGALKVNKAQRKIENFRKIKYWEIFEDKLNELEMMLSDAKMSLFQADRDIGKEIRDIRLAIESIENSNMSFRKKRSKLQKKYKESLEEIEYILKERSYTSLKKELYTLQGDIYTKMGMINSARKSYSDAERTVE